MSWVIFLKYAIIILSAIGSVCPKRLHSIREGLAQFDSKSYLEDGDRFYEMDGQNHNNYYAELYSEFPDDNTPGVLQK